MNSMLSAPFAVFFKLNLSFHQFFIFSRPVIYSFTYGTLQFY